MKSHALLYSTHRDHYEITVTSEATEEFTSGPNIIINNSQYAAEDQHAHENLLLVIIEDKRKTAEMR